MKKVKESMSPGRRPTLCPEKGWSCSFIKKAETPFPPLESRGGEARSVSGIVLAFFSLFYPTLEKKGKP
jgi:hypothetical protein